MRRDMGLFHLRANVDRYPKEITHKVVACLLERIEKERCGAACVPFLRRTSAAPVG